LRFSDENAWPFELHIAVSQYAEEVICEGGGESGCCGEGEDLPRIVETVTGEETETARTTSERMQGASEDVNFVHLAVCAGRQHRQQLALFGQHPYHAIVVLSSLH
jgi:hypothetical protein